MSVATQPPPTGDDVLDAALLVGGVIVVVVLGILVVYLTRRQLFAADVDESSDIGFTLHDLREMHRRGEISDEEYQCARDAMISSVRGTLEGSGEANENSEKSKSSEHGDSTRENKDASQFLLDENAGDSEDTGRDDHDENSRSDRQS